MALENQDITAYLSWRESFGPRIQFWRAHPNPDLKTLAVYILAIWLLQPPCGAVVCLLLLRQKTL